MPQMDYCVPWEDWTLNPVCATFYNIYSGGSRAVSQILQQFEIMCGPDKHSAQLDFNYHNERVIYQLATVLEYNKYLSNLSKNGNLLQEKEGCDVIQY